jgi:hypothetical protein
MLIFVDDFWGFGGFYSDGWRRLFTAAVASRVRPLARRAGEDAGGAASLKMHETLV